MSLKESEGKPTHKFVGRLRYCILWTHLWLCLQRSKLTYSTHTHGLDKFDRIHTTKCTLLYMLLKNVIYHRVDFNTFYLGIWLNFPTRDIPLLKGFCSMYQIQKKRQNVNVERIKVLYLTNCINKNLKENVLNILYFSSNN